MPDDDFNTNRYKEWVHLRVIHFRERETEPGLIRPEHFIFTATNDERGGTESVTLMRSEAVALRDWLTEHTS